MTQDTRKDPRAKIVSLNVRYKSATVDEFIDNHSHDVSKGGIFIKTPTPFPPGTLLKFEIRIAGDKAVIAGVGRVVWKRETAQSNPEQPSGMGVKFIKIDDPSRAIIDRLVDTKGSARSAYEEGGGDAAVAPPPGAAPTPADPVAKDIRKVAPKPASVVPARSQSAPPKPQPAPVRSPSLGPKAKPTVMGLGSVAPTAAAVKPLSVPTPAAGRPSGGPPRKFTPPAVGAPRPAAGSARPGSSPVSSDAGGMFPKTNSQGDMPPAADQTVMRQAAELLEEALRGAGGSMDEIGQNPLFDQVSTKAKDAESAAALAKLKQPGPPEHLDTVHGVGPGDVDELMKPIAELEQAAASERARRSSSPPAVSPAAFPARASSPASTRSRTTPTGPKASPRVQSAIAAVEETPSKNNWLLPVLLVAAAGGLAFFAYTEMHAAPTEIATPVPTPIPSAGASATPSAQPSASAPAPAASASAELSANGTVDAAPVALDASPADAAKASAPAAGVPPVAPPPRPRKPAPTATAPSPPPKTDETDPVPSPPSGTAPTPSPTGASTDIPGTGPATPGSITPKPAPTKAGTKPKSDDENPY